MGKSRSLENVVRQLSKSKTILGRWSFTHNWVERCAAWDNDLQAEKDRVALKEVAKWEQRRLETLEDQYREAMAMMAQGQMIANLPMLEKILEEHYPDGRVKNVVFKPTKVTKADMARIFDVAFRLRQDAIDRALPRSHASNTSESPQGPPRIIEVVVRGDDALPAPDASEAKPEAPDDMPETG